MNKLSVTPIGTCRINTPLKRAQSKFPIEINLARNYGFTHTSDEALQQLCYLQGDKQFREEVRPLVFRSEELTATAGDVWHKSDLHIVEISSAKKLTSGPDSVQLNYIYRHFADFFASSSRTIKFWSLVKRRQRTELAEFLRGEPTYRMMSSEDRHLLTSLRMEPQDFAAIKADMAEIVERLGRESLLFVTHVNAQTPDGSVIPARDRVIAWVKLAAEQLGAACFDPTAAMLEFGQERAMEEGGLDLTHYTPAFSDRIYAELHREHVGRQMELRPDLLGNQDIAIRQQMLADNIEALMRFDDFQAGARKLFAALRKDPDAPPLRQLRGKILAKLGDFEGAIRDLTDFERSSALSHEARIALLEAYTSTEQWEPALALAEGLLGDEYASRTIYQCAATACEVLGRTEAALNHWKQAFRYDRSDLNAALKGLALLNQLGRTDQLAAWREEVLQHAGLSANGAFEISRWAFEHRDEELLAQVFGAVFALDFDRAEELFNNVIAAGLFKAAAAALQALAPSDDGDSLERRRAQLIAKTSKLAAELLEQGQIRAAYGLAEAILKVRSDRLADRAKRTAEAQCRKAIREAYRLGDYSAAVELWQQTSEMASNSIDACLVVAISLNKIDRPHEALDLLGRLRDIAPSDTSVLRWLGRTAASIDRYEIALPSYVLLRRLDDSSAGQYSEETARFLAGADRRALRQLRETIIAGQLEQALDIADAIQADIQDRERLDREISRINRMLRLQLREIEKGDADEEDREQVLKLLLRMHPGDAAILRRAALEQMRRMRFREAAELWGNLEKIAPGVESNKRNLERCRILAARQEKSSTAGKLTVAS